MKNIQLGNSDFKKVIDKNAYYVDKTLLIKEFLDDGAEAILIPRPRRFGKTLNISMLKYFLENTDQDNSYLFKGLNIEKEQDVMAKQGKYPTIYITFKDEKHGNFEKLIASMKSMMADIYGKFAFLADNLILEKDKRFFNNVLSGKADSDELEKSLLKLSSFLNEHYNQKVIILIDEYDTPIHHGYFEGFYDQTISFIRNLLSNTLKDNIHLEKAMITGILFLEGSSLSRAEEYKPFSQIKNLEWHSKSIFSGLNNLNVCTLLDYEYSDKFGFTEKEIDKVIDDFEVKDKKEEFKDWYNGYIFGNTVIYNPWSTLSYLKSRNEYFKPYWVNTSENLIIKNILANGTSELKKSLEYLLNGGYIETTINENITMADIENSEENIWSFFLMSGYLKAFESREIEDEIYYKLLIPNKEVRSLYNSIVKSWSSESYISGEYEEMLKALVNYDFKVFKKIFSRFVRESFSYFDTSEKLPEKVYHAFALGLLIALNKTHQVLSNRESGYGRYDVMVIPRDISKIGIIIEFKKLDPEDEETVEEMLEEGFKQIEEKKYETELTNRGITNIKKMVIVFKGKEVFMR